MTEFARVDNLKSEMRMGLGLGSDGEGRCTKQILRLVKGNRERPCNVANQHLDGGEKTWPIASLFSRPKPSDYPSPSSDTTSLYLAVTSSTELRVP